MLTAGAHNPHNSPAEATKLTPAARATPETQPNRAPAPSCGMTALLAPSPAGRKQYERMSVDDHTLPDADQGPADQSPADHRPLRPALDRQTRRRIPGRGRARRPRRPRVRKLRLLFVIAAFGVLAVISTLFGVLTSIASDLPRLENTVQFSHTVDSYMYDDHGQPIGPLAPAEHTGDRPLGADLPEHAQRDRRGRGPAASGTSPASACAACCAPGSLT